MSKFKIATTVAISSFFILTGIFLALFPIQLVDLFASVLAILLLVLGSMRIIGFIVSRDNSPHVVLPTLVTGLITVTCGIFLLVYPGVISEVVKIAIAVWMFFSGGILLLTAYSYYMSREPNWFFPLFAGLLLLIASLILFFTPTMWLLVLSTFIAAYCVLIGLAGIFRLFLIVNQKNKKRKSIPFPFWLEAGFPRASLAWIRSSFEHTVDHDDIITSECIPPRTSNIEILIHLSSIGTNMLGHVDVVVDGEVFSYGNYDHAKEQIRLFGLFWDGVFAVCERNSYLKFSLESARKTIIGYQLKMEASDEQQLRDNIARFLAECEPWKPADPRRNAYANALIRHGAHLFKVMQGKFKTYFMLNTNCALLSDLFFEGTSIPRARAFGGVVTPGSLLSMYESELKRPGGPVISRALYVSERMATAAHETACLRHRQLADLNQCLQQEIKKQTAEKNV